MKKILLVLTLMLGFVLSASAQNPSYKKEQPTTRKEAQNTGKYKESPENSKRPAVNRPISRRDEAKNNGKYVDSPSNKERPARGRKTDEQGKKE
jgi:hypothetical protein